MWIHNFSNSSRFTEGGSPWSNRLTAVKEEDDSTSSSSIGHNSDALSGGDGDDSDENDDEVQSYNNGPINSLNDLEQVLPIKRSISTFYAGKSKSYGSLTDAISVPSIQDIVKPEDAYSRKRKNMIAHHVLMDKHFNSQNGISKRISRNSHDRNKNGESSVCLSLPKLPRNGRRLSTNESSDSSPRMYSSPWRSLSLSDLQHASDAISSITSSVSNQRDKNYRYDVYY